MNKTELAAEVTARLAGADAGDGTGPDARAYVDAVFDVIMHQVAAGDRVQVLGFGTFDGIHRAARAGRNPRTGAAIQIAASVTPRFQPGQTFRDRVGGGSSSSETAAAAAEAATPAPAVAEKDAPKKSKAKKSKASEAKSAAPAKPAKKSKPAKTTKAVDAAKAAKPAKIEKAAKVAKAAKATKTAKAAKAAKGSRAGKK